MAGALAEVAAHSPDSATYVIVTPDPAALSAALGSVAPEGPPAIVGGDWLRFAPRAEEKLVMPALVLLGAAGEPAFKWVGYLDEAALREVTEAFLSGGEPALRVPAGGDTIPALLKSILEKACPSTSGRTGTPLSAAEPAGYVLVFADPSCEACTETLAQTAGSGAPTAARTVLITPDSLETRDALSGSAPRCTIVQDQHLTLFSAMRVAVVPTVVLADRDGLIFARLDGRTEPEILLGALRNFGARLRTGCALGALEGRTPSD